MKKEYIAPDTEILANLTIEPFMEEMSIPTGGGDDKVDPEDALSHEAGNWDMGW